MNFIANGFRKLTSFSWTPCQLMWEQKDGMWRGAYLECILEQGISFAHLVWIPDVAFLSGFRAEAGLLEKVWNAGSSVDPMSL